MKRRILTIAALVGLSATLAGCAAWDRHWSSVGAQTFGADWVVAQYRFDGTPFNCWMLRNTSIANEERSDGVYWKDPSANHLVHISGWYNRVQVTNGDFAGAAKLVGVDSAQCGEGKYPKN